MVTGTKKAFVAGAAVGKNRFVKFGADDDTAIVAAAATDLIIGNSETHDVTSGDTFDVFMGDIGKVVLGGTVVRGNPLTSDATGAAIATVTVGHRIGGIALKSGVAGDVITYRYAPGVL